MKVFLVAEFAVKQKYFQGEIWQILCAFKVMKLIGGKHLSITLKDPFWKSNSDLLVTMSNLQVRKGVPQTFFSNSQQRAAPLVEKGSLIALEVNTKMIILT